MKPNSTIPRFAVDFPNYYKELPNVTHLDAYAVCKLFPVKDDSGAIDHARKKLLLAGTRNGGKPAAQDIKEAIISLQRYLELEECNDTSYVSVAEPEHTKPTVTKNKRRR